MSKIPTKDVPTSNEKNFYFKVEDLINLAFGPANKNLIHCKLIQTVLLILARHMRILEQKVEFRDKDGTTEVLFDKLSPVSSVEDKSGKIQKYKIPKLPKQLTTKAGEVIRELYEKTLLPDPTAPSPDKQTSESSRIRDETRTVEPAVIANNRHGKTRAKSADGYGGGRKSSWVPTNNNQSDRKSAPHHRRSADEDRIKSEDITDQSEASVIVDIELGVKVKMRPPKHTMDSIEEESFAGAKKSKYSKPGIEEKDGDRRHKPKDREHDDDDPYGIGTEKSRKPDDYWKQGDDRSPKDKSKKQKYHDDDDDQYSDESRISRKPDEDSKRGYDTRRQDDSGPKDKSKSQKYDNDDQYGNEKDKSRNTDKESKNNYEERDDGRGSKNESKRQKYGDDDQYGTEKDKSRKPDDDSKRGYDKRDDYRGPKDYSEKQTYANDDDNQYGDEKSRKPDDDSKRFYDERDDDSSPKDKSKSRKHDDDDQYRTEREKSRKPGDDSKRANEKKDDDLGSKDKSKRHKYDDDNQYTDDRLKSRKPDEETNRIYDERGDDCGPKDESKRQKYDDDDQYEYDTKREKARKPDEDSERGFEKIDDDRGPKNTSKSRKYDDDDQYGSEKVKSRKPVEDTERGYEQMADERGPKATSKRQKYDDDDLYDTEREKSIKLDKDSKPVNAPNEDSKRFYDERDDDRGPKNTSKSRKYDDDDQYDTEKVKSRKPDKAFDGYEKKSPGGRKYDVDDDDQYDTETRKPDDDSMRGYDIRDDDHGPKDKSKRQKYDDNDQYGSEKVRPRKPGEESKRGYEKWRDYRGPKEKSKGQKFDYDADEREKSRKPDVGPKRGYEIRDDDLDTTDKPKGRKYNDDQYSNKREKSPKPDLDSKQEYENRIDDSAKKSRKDKKYDDDYQIPRKPDRAQSAHTVSDKSSKFSSRPLSEKIDRDASRKHEDRRWKHTPTQDEPQKPELVEKPVPVKKKLDRKKQKPLKDILKFKKISFPRHRSPPPLALVETSKWVEERDRDKFLIEGEKFHLHRDQLKQLQNELLRRGLRLNAADFAGIMKAIRDKKITPTLKVIRTRSHEPKHDKSGRKGLKKRAKSAELQRRNKGFKKGRERYSDESSSFSDTVGKRGRRKKDKNNIHSSSTESDGSDEYGTAKQYKRGERDSRKRSGEDEYGRDRGKYEKRRSKSANEDARRSDIDMSEYERKGRGRSLDDYGRGRKDSIDDSERTKQDKAKKRRGDYEDFSDEFLGKKRNEDSGKKMRDQRSKSEDRGREPSEAKLRHRTSSEDILTGRRRGREQKNDEYGEGGRRGKGMGEKDRKGRVGEDDEFEGGRGKGRDDRYGRGRVSEDDDYEGKDGRSRGKGYKDGKGRRGEEFEEGSRRGKRMDKDGRGQSDEDSEYDSDGWRGDDRSEKGRVRDAEDEYEKRVTTGKGRRQQDGRSRGGEDDDDTSGHRAKGKGDKDRYRDERTRDDKDDYDEGEFEGRGKGDKYGKGRGGEDFRKGGKGGQGLGDRDGRGRGRQEIEYDEDRRRGRGTEDTDRIERGKKEGDDYVGESRKGKSKDKYGKGRGGRDKRSGGSEDDEYAEGGRQGKELRGRRGDDDDKYGRRKEDRDGRRKYDDEYGIGKGQRRGDDDEYSEGSRRGKGDKGGDDRFGKGRDGDKISRRTSDWSVGDRDKRGKRQRESEDDSAKRDGKDTDGRGKAPSRRKSLTVEEETRGKDKVIVVKKKPSRVDSRSGPPRVGSIECVTQEEFQELEERVRKLQEKSGPLPLPKLPDNKKLRSDIAKGSATLTDAMKAMQLSARVDAAEKAVDRLADMMTQLAAQGSLPKELAEAANIIKAQLAGLLPKDKDVFSLIEKGAVPGFTPDQTKKKVKDGKSDDQSPDVASRFSQASGAVGGATGGVGGRGGRYQITPPMPYGATKDKRMIGGKGAGPGFSEFQDFSSGTSLISKAESSRRTSVSKRFPRDTAGAGADFNSALRKVWGELLNVLEDNVGRTNNAAQAAMNMAKTITHKLDLALSIDDRINSLKSTVEEYAQQLNGFDQGLATQLLNFHQQMNELKGNLNAGLEMLKTVQNSAETEAVMELTDRYEALVFELEGTVHDHLHLVGIQEKLSLDLNSLINAVENMREQKADRDEVLDALKDKADVTRLQGLLRDDEFKSAITSFDGRLLICHKKFDRQDKAWMNALKDIRDMTKEKAQLIHLQALRAEEQSELQDLLQKIQMLTKVLGEPKAAVLTRKISLDGRCAACRIPAMMDGVVPPGALIPLLPPLRPPPAGAEADDDRVCLQELQKVDSKTHVCQRWVGGSHTLINEHVHHEQAPEIDQGPSFKQYLSEGSDGKVYKLEVPLMPCEECNVEPKIPGETEASPKTGGGGDQVNVINVADARRVTILNDDNIQRAEVFEAKSKELGSKRSSMPSNDQPLRQFINQRVSIGARSSMASRRNTAQAQDLTMLTSAPRKFFATPLVPEETKRRLLDVGSIVKGQITRLTDAEAMKIAIRQENEKMAEATRLRREFTGDD